MKFPSLRRLAAGLAVLLAAGCAPGGSPSPLPSPAASGTSASEPVVIENCGMPVSFPEAPQRIVAIKSTSLDMLFALGLADRIVATAFLDEEVPPAYREALRDVPNISDDAPTQEVLLGLEPDFIYAGWASNLSVDGPQERAHLDGLGIGTYVSPVACEDAGADSPVFDEETIFSEVAELGRIFRVDASGLVASQRELLASVKPVASGPRTLWYSSGTATPFVAGGTGAPAFMMRRLGLDNVVAEVVKPWASVAWEVVASREPELIVLVDSVWNTKAHKAEVLAANPAMRQLPAVAKSHYLSVSFAEGAGSITTIPALVRLAAELKG